MKKIYTLFVALFFANFAMAQVTLTGTSYTQNFDAIASGLPTGFSVTGTSSNTSLGTNSAFAAAAVDWNNTSTAGWRNSASADGLLSSSNSAAQSASTDRSLGVRQTGAFGDAGAALNFGIANTIGITGVNLSFKLQSLDVASTRTTTWVVQYGFGAAPASFTTATAVGTLTTGASSFSNNTITVNFGTTLDNSASPVWIRVRAATASTGTGNRATTGFDDFALSYTNNGLPACVSPTTLPSALVFSSITTNGLQGSFAAGTANGYVVIRSTSATLSATPTDGVDYSLGDIIGGGTVVSESAATNFIDNGLTQNTTYYYHVYAYNNSGCSGGPAYVSAANSLINSATTLTAPACAIPINPPGVAVVSTVTNTGLSGSYGASADADSYLVLITESASPGFTPADGTVYTVGQALGSGTVIKYGTGLTFSATGLTQNTLYYIYIFAFNNANCVGGPLYNTVISTTNATTTNTTTGGPAGYYNAAAGLTCANLKTALRDIITTGNTARTYGALWTEYLTSDIKPREVGPGTSTNVIWDIYSDIPGANNDPYNFTPGTQQDAGGAASSEGILYNREHSVPQNWFNGDTGIPGATTDYHHIFPTDKFVNNERSNFIYGKVTNPTNTYLNGSKKGPANGYGLTGIAFEPIDAYKGDVARAFLYFVTRYQNNMPTYPASTSSTNNGAQAFDASTYPSVDINYLSMMIAWHNVDPVSAKEIARNDAAQVFQGNRNPYIDNPSFVSSVWNNTCGITLLSAEFLKFIGLLQNDAVQLQWQIAENVQTDYFVIEKSNDGVLFSYLTTIQPNNTNVYSYKDAFLNKGVAYYRIKRISITGAVTYSKVIKMITTNSGEQLKVFPNPAQNVVNIQLPTTINNQIYITISTVTGNTVWSSQQKVNGNVLSLPVTNFAAGQYLITVALPNGNYRTKVVVMP
jgi:endonuclease I